MACARTRAASARLLLLVLAVGVGANSTAPSLFELDRGVRLRTTPLPPGCRLRVELLAAPPTAAIVVQRNAKENLLSCALASSPCAADFALEMREATAAVYLLDTAAGLAARVGAVPLPACADAALLPAAASTAAVPGLVVGLLYEGWQGYAANASATVAAMGGTPLSVEDVIRSNGSLVLDDIWYKYGVDGLTQGFFYQERPQLGFYCIYRKRVGEAGVLPDCANITGIVSQQALWFAQSGVDFVTVDGTNLCTPSPFADAIQTRPAEVLFEEFAALRAAGFTTPAISAWQRVVTGCSLHTQILEDIYNNEAFGPLVYRDPTTGKKVFFVPDSPDPTIVSEIEANGGRNDIVVQEMWALFSNETYSTGRWAFESPCTDTASEGTGPVGFTTSVVGRGRGASGCGQFVTEDSALGSAIAVSPSYQESYGSVPFSAANKYEGLTFKRQFATIFDRVAVGLPLPQNLYLGSWNEFISQPQSNPFGSPFAFSMGLEWDTKSRGALWVDSFGASLSRDIEPSSSAGSLIFDIMASCLRVVRLLEHVGAAHITDTNHVRSMFSVPRLGKGGGAACAVAGEECCAYNETTDGYALASALVSSSRGDALLTLDPDEVARLTCPGCGYAESCNGYGGGSDFCVDAEVLKGAAAMQGPFVLHAACVGDRVPLNRCLSADGRHFASTSVAADCGEAGAKLESALGCMAAWRSSNMPRSLRLCSASAPHGGRRYHSLDAECESGDAGGAVAGFVH